MGGGEDNEGGMLAGGISLWPPLLPFGIPPMPDGDGEFDIGRPGALGDGKLGGITAVPRLLSLGTPALSNGKLGLVKGGPVWLCADDGTEPTIMSTRSKALFIEPSDR